MNLKDLPIADRRQQLAAELELELDLLQVDPATVGQADQKNCENLFGTVPIPVGYAGPLPVTFSSGETAEVHLPLATTEGALVASVNRGCKALRESGIETSHTYHGITRSIAFEVPAKETKAFTKALEDRADEWKTIGEATSSHLKILNYEVDTDQSFVFLTIAADTDEAMGMNMVTIAAQAIGDWITENLSATFITVAGNIDSDKKPSKRTHDKGRGYEVTASALLSPEVIETVLKTTPAAMLKVAQAKLESGSTLAGAIGKNLHIGNIVAALYLATGQDAAHVSEGALGDTTVTASKAGLQVSARLPAVIVGVRGGGTDLPAQRQCLNLLLKNSTKLPAPKQLAESIGAAVLAGEVSLLAAQASHHLTQAHQTLGR